MVPSVVLVVQLTVSTSGSNICEAKPRVPEASHAIPQVLDSWLPLLSMLT